MAILDTIEAPLMDTIEFWKFACLKRKSQTLKSQSGAERRTTASEQRERWFDTRTNFLFALGPYLTIVKSD